MATPSTPTRSTRPAAKKAATKKATPVKKAAPNKAAAPTAAKVEPTATAAPTRAARRLPNVEIPKVRLPEVDFPKVQLPKFELPEIKVPEIKVPEQLATVQQHVVSAAKQMAAQVNDRLDPSRRRTVVLERVERVERDALKALERAMSRTAPVRERIDLPFAPELGKAVRANVEFAVKLAKRQADFAERVVKTLVPAA
jgi:hypothetical protein